MQNTPQHNSLKTRITRKLAKAFRYLIYKHSPFLRHRVTRALPNAATVKVITTLETILNEEVGYRFCQVILLFWLQQKVVPYTKYKIQKKL